MLKTLVTAYSTSQGERPITIKLGLLDSHNQSLKEYEPNSSESWLSKQKLP